MSARRCVRKSSASGSGSCRHRRHKSSGVDRRWHVRNWRVGETLESHFLPGAVRADQRSQQFVVQRMSGFEAAELADQAMSQQIQVADCIEDLVLDELVLITQSVFVQD